MLAQYLGLTTLACGQQQLLGQAAGIEEERAFERRAGGATECPGQAGQAMEEASSYQQGPHFDPALPLQTVKLAVLGHHRTKMP